MTTLAVVLAVMVTAMAVAIGVRDIMDAIADDRRATAESREDAAYWAEVRAWLADQHRKAGRS